MPAGSGGVLGGTFHSVAHRFLRLHAAALGPGARVRGARRRRRGGPDRHDPRGARPRPEQAALPKKSTLLDIYSRTVNAQQPLPASSPSTSRGARTTSRRWPRCSRPTRPASGRSACSTSTTCSCTGGRWPPTRSTGRTMEDAFDHLLIDEYQDVNGLQVDIVRALRGAAARRHGRRRRPAGDLRLARRVRRAHPAVPRALPRRGGRHAGAQLPLHAADPRRGERARRAGDPGVPEAAAQRARGTAPGPTSCSAATRRRRPTEVCDRVLEAREHGMELREQAVLTPHAHDTDLLELELTRRRIPYVKYGGLRYLEAAHVKDFIALLRLADNPADEISWFRVLQLLEGVGPATAGGRSTCWWPGAMAGRARGSSCPPGRRPPADAVVAALRETPRAERRCAGRAAARRAGAADRGALPGRCAAPARPRAAGRGGARVGRGAAALRRRAGARPAAVERRPGRAAAPRRGLPRALHRPLGKGPRVAGGARARPVRRQLPGGHGGRLERGASTRSAGCSTSR